MLDCTEKPENHCVYFDKFFTSRDLLIHLRNLGFRAIGTVRENRVGDCPLLSSNELGGGKFEETMTTSSTGMVKFVRWHDNRCVQLIQILTKLNLWEQLRGTVDRQVRRQAAVLKSCNVYMGCVDHHDWLIGKYATIIRGKKIVLGPITRLQEMALVNA
ncbi:piggyBac transposable element-derived protein 1-like [Schistocerca gregaria]|uniref:piggyBac transposable element-derived protein 1-like n=1 Tax=Schistocerca gregaria TaxID=7010 RepID=UPI00211F4464|nr:piggyBac transposable element-derived protein 1-like [Schistocerca gregaria]